MKDLGEADKYLGLNVKRISGEIHIHLQDYILGTIGKLGLKTTPHLMLMEANIKLEKEESQKASKEFLKQYRELTGYLNYIATKVRYDIAYAARAVSRFNSNPNRHHLNAVMRIFRYLAHTSRRGIIYRENPD